MSAQVIVVAALKISIILTVFGFGLQATRDDLLFVLRRPRILVRSLIAMFLIMPFFALLLTHFVSLNLPVAIALIVLSISPVPPLLPKRMNKSGGLAPFGIGLMVTAAALSIVYIPVAVYLLGKYFGRPFSMGPTAVAKLVVITVFVPLAAGMIVRKFAPTLAARLSNPIIRVAGVLLILGAVCVLAFALPSVWAIVGNGTIIAFVVFVLVGLLVGHLLGGSNPEQRSTLAVSTACRHPALALAIAAANAPKQHQVLSAVLLYLLVNTILTIPYIKWQRKEELKVGSASKAA